MNYLGLVVFLLFSSGSGVFVVWIYLPVGAGIGRRVFTDRVMVCYPRTYKCDRLGVYAPPTSTFLLPIPPRFSIESTFLRLTV